MNLKKCIICLLLLWHASLFADTLGKYASIAKNIPSMELKADAQSQAWARSARSVLAVTDEAIAQSVVAMNSLGLKNGTPLICSPPDTQIDTSMIHNILSKYISTMAAEDANKSISEVVVTILTNQYPCHQMARNRIGLPSLTIQRIHHVDTKR